MRLLLIRHGQTSANTAGLIDTAPPGPALTQLGQRQAEELVQRLADEPITAVYVSTLTRTALTAAPLARARALPVGVIEGIDEVRAGVFEGRGDPEAIDGYVGMLLRWYAGDFAASLPPGVDGSTVDGLAFLRDYDEAIETLAERHSGETVAVVSHGAAIRAWVAKRAVNAAGFGAALRTFDNTGIARLRRDEAGWHLLSWEGRPGEVVLPQTEPSTGQHDSGSDAT